MLTKLKTFKGLLRQCHNSLLQRISVCFFHGILMEVKIYTVDHSTEYLFHSKGIG
jgi:hypothetical protein